MVTNFTLLSPISLLSKRLHSKGFSNLFFYRYRRFVAKTSEIDFPLRGNKYSKYKISKLPNSNIFFLKVFRLQYLIWEMTSFWVEGWHSLSEQKFHGLKWTKVSWFTFFTYLFNWMSGFCVLFEVCCPFQKLSSQSDRVVQTLLRSSDFL